METFLSGEVSATHVERLRKEELVEVVKHLSSETQTEGLKKAQVKAKVIQLLTEKGLLKAVAKTREMSQIEYNLEIRKLEAQERKEERERQERKEEKERQEKERERQFQREESDKEREEAEKQRQFKLRELEIKGEQQRRKVRL